MSETQVVVETRKLGLAAYIKLKGAVFLGYDNNVFRFESDRSEKDWDIEYMNTEAHRHDMELIHLRKLMR